MNVSSLARQLKITTQELLEKLPALGFDIGARAIKVDDKLVPKILTAWKRAARRTSLQEEMSLIKEIHAKDEQNPNPNKNEKKVSLPEIIIVKDLAEMMRLPVARLMAELMRNGIMVSLNEKIDFDTATIIAEDLGFQVEKSDHEVAEEENKRAKLEKLLATRGVGDIRPPVVVVMGHVDHGKTKLLDAIRETNVVDQEAGGITQHIGAYQVKTHDRLLTFLDTPGHEAFKAMRSRGGQIADVAILVVAADDGLQPQTLESLAVIQKEKLPFIVAINKIDKEGADLDKVKQQLTELNLTPEDWGGTTICQPISAKLKTGINELLDLILLVVDMNELKADATGDAVGTIIESHIDKSEGPVATVLVQAGTLKIGDTFVVGAVSGKIKTLKNWSNQDVSSALPAMPVKILGLKQAPLIGEILEVVNDKKEFKTKSKNLNGFQSNKNRNSTNNNTDDENASVLNLIIKADVFGSAEAIEESLSKIKVPNTKVKVLKKGLGQINEADVLNAEATGSLLVGFHIKENKNIISLATDKKVKILYFDIIYKLLEDIERRLETIKIKKTVHNISGKMQILAIFKTNKDSMIVGGKVLEGKVLKNSKIKVLRHDEIEAVGELKNLQAGKENVNEVVAGTEAGLEYKGDPIIQVGDILEFFQEVYE